MSVCQSISLLGFYLLCLSSLDICEAGCTDASKIDSRELRGRLNGCEPGKKGAKTSEIQTEKDEKDEKDVKSQPTKFDNSGSQTNKDIQKIEKAVATKVGKHIYNFPLGWRLCIVAGLLAAPLLIIAGLVYSTPPQEHASSIYIKTALHCGFSFTVGWLNCIMLLRYRVFATMMVGNTILMGVAFICNGGFTTAQEEDYWWLGQKARVLCPAQFESAGNYAIMIGLFVLGAFTHGVLHRLCKWSSRPFAPFIAAGIIAIELLEFFQVITEAWTDVFLLSPIFGMFVSISAHGGVGSVPWSATGHMTSMAYKFASFVVSPWDRRPDLTAALVNFCLWVSFVFGIMMGTLFHSNRTVCMNALYLQGILIINGVIYSSPVKDKSDDSFLLEDADTNGINCEKAPAVNESFNAGTMPATNYSSCKES